MFSMVPMADDINNTIIQNPVMEMGFEVFKVFCCGDNSYLRWASMFDKYPRDTYFNNDISMDRRSLALETFKTFSKIRDVRGRRKLHNLFEKCAQHTESIALGYIYSRADELTYQIANTEIIKYKFDEIHRELGAPSLLKPEVYFDQREQQYAVKIHVPQGLDENGVPMYAIRTMVVG